MKRLLCRCLALVTCLFAAVFAAEPLLPEYSALSLAPGDAGRTRVHHGDRTVCSVGTEPTSAMSGVTLALRDGAIVVDNREAPADLLKTVLRMHTIKMREFAGKFYVLRVQIEGPQSGHAALFFEGRTLDGVHYHNSTKQNLNGQRQELLHYHVLPSDLVEVHLRLDLTGPGVYKIFTAELDEVPLRQKDPAVVAARVPELLFHADFDGTVIARRGGQQEPMVARGIDYAPGVKGQALKSSREAGTLLQYAMAGNAVPECGTVSLWYRPSWTRSEDANGFHQLFAMERPEGSRFGSGSVFLWCHNDVLRADTSDLRDSYQRTRSVLSNQWQHLAMSWDEDGALVYFNGRPTNDMPGGDSYSPLNFSPSKHLIFRDSVLKSFFVGGFNGEDQCEGLIDDLRVYSAPLPREDVLAIARDFRYFDVAVTQSYLVNRGDGANAIAFSITPQQPAAMRFRWQVVAEDGRVLATSGEAVAISAADVGRARTLSAAVPALAPGRYEIRVTEDLYKGSTLDSLAVPVWIFHDTNAEVSATDELRLEPLATIRPNPSMSADELLYVGIPTMGELAGRPYMEIDGAEGSRFVLRLTLPDAEGMYLLEWDYPDDKLRTVDIVAQSTRMQRSEYELQTGYCTGDEYPSSGQMLTQKCVYYAHSTDVALVFMTTRKNAPAAVAEVRVSRIVGGLPALGGAALATPAGGGRSVGIYYEDPAVLADFGRYANVMPGLEQMLDRLSAYMQYSGQTLLTYPLVWYQGRIGDRYNPRNHPVDFFHAVLAVFDRDGLSFMPSFNHHNIYFPDLALSEARLEDGSLHDTPVSILNTGKPNPGGWHGTPPNFNVMHPAVQEHILANVQQFIDEGAAHPSFKGITLHLTNHCLASFGELSAGYNDYVIDAFSRATGIAVPVSRQEPLRGKLYYEWLMAHAREEWIDWRCQALAEFYGRIAERLRQARPDLRLVICNLGPMGEVKSENFRDEDFVTQRYRGAGLDPKYLTAIPNVTLVQTTIPADYRWRRGHGSEDPNLQHLRDFDLLPGTYSLLNTAPAPWLHMHDRYWESAIGRRGGRRWNGPGEGELGAWFSEQSWRVSTLNPAGVHAMRHYIAPLRHNDLLGITKGGFLIGTHGMDELLRPFARAFRALPAQRFADVASSNDAITLRRLEHAGATWFYVVNTTATPAEAALRLSAPARDVVSGVTVPAGELRLPMTAYEFRAFRADGALGIEVK
ncbi:MAG: hypothetical protein PHT80_13525 [Lentisphaeria bacterium]|nr:hypothetical protein [Lentisphaeria bacterium]